MSCIVYRREVTEFLDAFFHTLIHDYTLAEFVTALHHAVSHGINLRQVLDGTYLGIREQ